MLKVLSIGLLAYFVASCASKKQAAPEPAPSLSVMEVQSGNTITYRSYPAAIEGSTNVEIRPQAEGMLKTVYADEGSYVVKGQALFKIDEAPFLERLNEAEARMHSAEGALAKASLELEKLAPLVESKVVSEHQLKVAKAAYQVELSNVQHAKALVATARINLGYCSIKAPINGYIGRLLKKQGSLIGPHDLQPLTLLSDVHRVHVYFALAESDFIRFKTQYAGATLLDKLAKVPPVSLILSDESTYISQGKIDMVDGQFDKTTGSITLRASFPNVGGVLRSGNTGKVLLPLQHTNVVVIPQAATRELQDKVFVFMLSESNRVSRQPIEVIGKSGANYLVQEGVRPGDRIVAEGLDHLQEGQVVQPKPNDLQKITHTSTN